MKIRPRNPNQRYDWILEWIILQQDFNIQLEGEIKSLQYQMYTSLMIHKELFGEEKVRK